MNLFFISIKVGNQPSFFYFLNHLWLYTFGHLSKPNLFKIFYCDFQECYFHWTKSNYHFNLRKVHYLEMRSGFIFIGQLNFYWLNLFNLHYFQRINAPSFYFQLSPNLIFLIPEIPIFPDFSIMCLLRFEFGYFFKAFLKFFSDWIDWKFTNEKNNFPNVLFFYYSLYNNFYYFTFNCHRKDFFANLSYLKSFFRFY